MSLPDPVLEGVDQESTRAFRAFLRAMRLHGQLMFRAMSVHGAHPGQAICLRLLESNDGVTQRDLAAELHLARPTMSRMLGGMEKSGLIERRPDERDQRLMRVFLTDDGRKLAADLHGVAGRLVNETIGSLPQADRAELARLLEELGARMRAVAAARAAADGVARAAAQGASGDPVAAPEEPASRPAAPGAEEEQELS